MGWVKSDYSRCSNKELLEEYNEILKEILKRFKRKKMKKTIHDEHRHIYNKDGLCRCGKYRGFKKQ